MSTTQSPDRRSIMARVKRFFGLKTEEEITTDVHAEPHVQRALKVIDRNRALMDELEALEKRNRR